MTYLDLLLRMVFMIVISNWFGYGTAWWSPGDLPTPMLAHPVVGILVAVIAVDCGLHAPGDQR